MANHSDRKNEDFSSNSSHIQSNIGLVNGQNKSEPTSQRPGGRHIRVSSLHKRPFHHELYTSPPVSPTYSKITSSDLSLPSPQQPPSRSSLSETIWLCLYFLFNLSLTLYNKSVLIRFPFPYTLSALHALLGTVGGAVLVKTRFFEPARLNSQERGLLFAFSLLYTINIVVSNISLQLVTVAFHQVVRAATPIFTILFWSLISASRSSNSKIASLAVVSIGVAFATYGDFYFSWWGFAITLLGTVLAAAKTIVTNLLQVPVSSSDPKSHTQNSSIIVSLRGISLPRLHPLDLLNLLSPLACIQCVLLAYLSGELDRVREYSATQMTLFKATSLLVNGCLAFGLNVVSFTANKKVGPLSMTVAANVKQALTILSGVLVFDLTITLMNGFGILLTIVGGVCYAHFDILEKRGSRKNEE